MWSNKLAWLLLSVLLCSLTLTQSKHDASRDRLSDIRLWAAQHQVWPRLEYDPDHPPLIAVREIYRVEQQQLEIRAFLMLPCENLCGATERCARHCQKLIMDWTESLADEKLLIEVNDVKDGRRLGRVLLNQVAPIELRYLSRQQHLIALLQKVNADEHLLHILRMADTETRDHQRQSETSPMQEVSIFAQYNLGPFTGREHDQGSVSFTDLDRDGRVELIAPHPLFTQLTPMPLAVPTPYRLGERVGDVKFAPDLIEIELPKTTDLREWLMQRRGPQASSTQEILRSQVERHFVDALLICLRGECDRGEDLIRFAYPQHDTVLRLWEQVRQRLDHEQREVAPQRQHPFSTLED